ncbi:MAG: hypothetical protein FJ211_01790 [Ignavibacteria bacterium]|nr:hypothetical protein [Ignavibacteria bacterium]
MRVLLFVVVLLTGICTSWAQQYATDMNSEGTEFWLCFMKNFREAGKNDQAGRQGSLRLQLFVTSNHNAKVRIEIEQLQYENTITVKANTVVNVQIPAMAQLSAVQRPERLAVHVTADSAIGVYGLSSRYQTTDTYLGLPTTVLGTEYRAVGYSKIQVSPEMLSGLSIVATDNETEVTITPRVITALGNPPGVPFTVKLQRGDVYTVTARWETVGMCDMTGTLVKSNKKIAVFSGHACAYIPPKVEACNHLIEQLPPLASWGKHYYVGMLKDRSRYTYRVVAANDSTKVFEDARLVATLRSGEHYENLNCMKSVQVTADKPILVAQFAQGFKNGDSVGDPMMILVSPTQQFMKKYRFATPINGDWNHYINLVSQKATASKIRLNGRLIDTNLFVPLGESRYAMAQVKVPFGSHVIEGSAPFGLYSYGFGFDKSAYDAYGNMAGQSFYEANAIEDKDPPMADGNTVKDGYAITFRDDRDYDKGLQSITLVSSTGTDVVIPPIVEGVPQATLVVKRSGDAGSAKVVFRATDAAGNVQDFTVCQLYDNTSNKVVYALSEGNNPLCEEAGAWMIGASATYASAVHDLTVKIPIISKAQQSFNSAAIGSSYGVATTVSWRARGSLMLTGSIGLSAIGGTIVSPDTAMATVFDTASARYTLLQQATEADLSLTNLDVSLGLEWYALKYFFVGTGVRLGMNMSANADVRRTILRPSSWTYQDGTRTSATEPVVAEPLSTNYISVYGTVGFLYPVTYSSSVSAEMQYSRSLGDIATTGPWTLQRLGIVLGYRYRL